MTRRGAVIFDFDGTLTRPHLDFDAIRAEIGVSGPILEAMALLAPSERNRAESILLRHEWDAARHAELQDGAAEVLADVREMGFSTAILTRNAREPVAHVLTTFGMRVDALRTREDGAIKPSAEPVLALCRQLNASPTESWVVGDFLFDILSGRAAGARTVLMIGDSARPAFADQADHVIRSLLELPSILKAGA